MDKLTPPDGLWEMCANLEALVTSRPISDLVTLERAFKLTYEAGVQSPTLPSSRQLETDMRIASLFLKRMLNDLRGTWLLLSSGYTSQSATVAASLWENAMAVSCLAGQPERTRQTLSHRDTEFPWKPMELAKLCAADQTDCHTVKSDVYEMRWREHYAPYRWLCKLKHPTLKSALHDAFSTEKDTNTYVVMALPDFREENLGVKLGVGTIALNRALSSIATYVRAADSQEACGEYQAWEKRWREAADINIETMTNGARPVLTVEEDSQLLREYNSLKGKHNSTAAFESPPA